MSTRIGGGLLSDKNFWRVIAMITLVRLMLAWWLPVKNDEAYYILWAQHLAPGYFDHPPLIGWLLHLMSYVSGSIFWFRLLAIAAGLFATYAVYYFARSVADDTRARFAALLFALSPANVLLFIISNDAPLLIFSLLAVMSFRHALARTRIAYALLAGVFLGLAFLAKYLAVLIGLGLLVYALMADRRRRLIYLAVMLAGVAPFVAQHVYFNYHHDWVTLNFHLYLRGAGRVLDWKAPVSLVAGALMVFTPWVVWALARRRAQLKAPGFVLPLSLIATAMVLLMLAALKSVIGLHFFLLFAPYVYVLTVVVDAAHIQRRMLIASMVYATVLVLTITGVYAYPWQRMAGARQQADVVFGVRPDAVCQALAPYDKLPLFADFYTPAAILDYTCARRVGVLFAFSSMGRDFDRYTDIAALDGKTLAIFNIGKVERPRFRSYFRRYRIDTVYALGAPFTVFVGEGFDAAKYQREIGGALRRRFYSPPAWLPRAQDTAIRSR